jgi:hypothetical protein
MSEMVSYCHHAKTEPRWVQDGWGRRDRQEICLKCWRPCDLISSDLLVDDLSRGDSI